MNGRILITFVMYLIWIKTKLNIVDNKSQVIMYLSNYPFHMQSPSKQVYLESNGGVTPCSVCKS